MKINKEGLTFEEWYNAATIHSSNPISCELARCEWMRGVDPTEYADSSARKEKAHRIVDKVVKDYGKE